MDDAGDEGAVQVNRAGLLQPFRRAVSDIRRSTSLPRDYVINDLSMKPPYTPGTDKLEDNRSGTMQGQRSINEPVAIQSS